MIRKEACKNIEFCQKLLKELIYHVTWNSSGNSYIDEYRSYTKEPVRRTRLMINQLLKEVEG